MIKYNLILGDCLEEMKKMPDGFVDVVFTSPPITIVVQQKAIEKIKGISNMRLQRIAQIGLIGKRNVLKKC